MTTLHNGSHTVTSKASLRSDANFFHCLYFIPGCGFAASFHCTGSAGKGDVMSILSTKASFAIAAAVVASVSFASFAASAGPLTLKKPCIGCTPNTWTPGYNNHWNGGGG